MESFWSTCIYELRRDFDANLFDAFISDLRVRNSENQLTILAPNSASIRWLEQNISGYINRIAQQRLGKNISINFEIDDLPAADNSPATTVAPRVFTTPAASSSVSYQDTNLHPNFTFDNFMPGHANELALAAAKSICNGPYSFGRPGMPLILYGHPGMGKTHLAQAIGNHYYAQNPTHRARYITARDFMTDVVNTCRTNQHDKFKNRYSRLDVLIIDDIQYIGGDKVRTQEEFFFIFNELHRQNKIIIITADKPPSHINNLPARIISRLQSGQPAHLFPPELELREAILRHKAKKNNIAMDEKIIRFIAEKVKSDVRRLEGALNQVINTSNLLNKPISLDLCRNVLTDLIDSERRPITIEIIKNKVASFFNIRVSDLSSSRRHRSIVYPRHIAIYLCRKLTNFSLPDIGNHFGNREHTTVLHSYRKIEKLRVINIETEEEIKVLEAIIKS